MQEPDRQDIEHLLNEQTRQRQEFAAEQERVRQYLEAKGRLILEQYQQRWEELEPAAREGLETIIKPWWRDLIEPGTYSRLIDEAKRDDVHNVRFSDPIVYPWPHNVLGELASAKPYDYNAKLIVEYRAKGNIKQAKSQEIWCAGDGDNEELWRASFYIEGHYYDQSTHGFRISRWPLFGGGFAFATGSARRLEIPLQHEEADQLIIKIHPSVLIGFAEQISSGRVWEVVRDSLTPKPIRTITREEYDRGMVELREQYLGRKHWAP